MIADEWDDRTAFRADVAREVEEAVRRHVEAILDAGSASDGSGTARLLFDEVAAALRNWP